MASAERNGTELIAVVLNDHDWFEDAYRLLDYGFEAFERVVIARAETPLISAVVMEGDSDTVKIGSDTDISCLEAEGEISDLSIIYDVPDAVSYTHLHRISGGFRPFSESLRHLFCIAIWTGDFRSA